MDNINEEKIEDILSDEIDLEDTDSTEKAIAKVLMLYII